MAKSNTMIVRFGIGESLSMIEGPKIGDLVAITEYGADYEYYGFIVEIHPKLGVNARMFGDNQHTETLFFDTHNTFWRLVNNG